MRKDIITRFLIILLVSISCLSCSYERNANKQIKRSKSLDMMAAEIIFKDTLYDFGTFSAAEPIRKHTFIFTNNGQVPAVILHATPSCHCTSVEYSKEAVMPGKQGQVTVIFNGSDQKAGFFDKSVRLRFNAKYNHTLRIKGQMIHK